MATSIIKDITPADIGAVATDIETSQIFLDSSVSNLDIPASLGGGSLMRLGKIYILTYSIVIQPFTFQHSTDYINLIRDEQGWLNEQINNIPTVTIDPNTTFGEALHGTTVVFTQDKAYSLLRISVNATWLDPF